MNDVAALGTRGEELAAGYLRRKGYIVRDRNWRSGRTEIDIVAENPEFIIFIEVKTRSADFAVHPSEAVNVPKQRTIINAASNYISRYHISKEARFDIITIVMGGNGPRIDHIENAYYPTM
jgi:putative endonuclease